jgi:alginate O-acetyltransferase complex protein AlgJ
MSNKDLPAADLQTPAPSRYAAVAGITLLCVMLAGLWQIVAAAWNPAQLDFPRTWLDFREGRTTGALEKQLDKKLPARSALITIANTLRYLLTGGGGDQVRVGSGGWLFLTDELKFDPDGSAHLDARATLFGGAARGLNRQGVKLVVALVPDKARLYSSKLIDGHYPAYNLSRYRDSLAALRKQDVTVVDLLTPLAAAALQRQVYYSSDTHWNQTGAQISAIQVGLAVRNLGVELEKTTFVTTAAGEKTERPGDLIRLMGLGDTPNALRPPPDIEIPVVTKQTSIEAASGLFGDAALPVALTGTSYSLRGNFHGFLQQALSAKVLNTAKDGGGLLQAATAYLKDDAFKSAKPKILVWEVPERFLYTKLDLEPNWLESVGLLP